MEKCLWLAGGNLWPWIASDANTCTLSPRPASNNRSCNVLPHMHTAPLRRGLDRQSNTTPLLSPDNLTDNTNQCCFFPPVTWLAMQIAPDPLKICCVTKHICTKFYTKTLQLMHVLVINIRRYRSKVTCIGCLQVDCWCWGSESFSLETNTLTNYSAP